MVSSVVSLLIAMCRLIFVSCWLRVDIGEFVNCALPVDTCEFQSQVDIFVSQVYLCEMMLVSFKVDFMSEHLRVDIGDLGVAN